MFAFRTLLLGALLCLPATASAVTIRDLIELTKAGVPDDVLVALIEADRTVFTLEKEQILELKAAGVSNAVLLKMLRTRREFDTPATPPVVTDTQSAQPGIVVIGVDPKPEPVTVVVPQYYYLSYPIWGVPPPNFRHTPPVPFMPGYRGFGRFINDGWVDRRY